MGEAILSHKNWRRQPRTVSLCGVGRATYDVAELGFRSSRRSCVWAGQLLRLVSSEPTYHYFGWQ